MPESWADSTLGTKGQKAKIKPGENMLLDTTESKTGKCVKFLLNEPG